MDHLDQRRGDAEIDLESGSNTSEEDGGGKHQKLDCGNSKEGLHRALSAFLRQGSHDALAKSEQDFCSDDKVSNSDDIFVNNWEKIAGNFGEEVESFAAKKTVQEKSKAPKSKWPPKPPRPPGGPMLHPADMKLVKEISELAILKRKRTERRKALDKMRKEKTSSKTSNVIAMKCQLLFAVF
ncbi:OLC1v1002080C1 [Oldenlandia corymbosa var. corymbosa]|uniref:OLC1v1002080C1 n=1 Tax=Oldenlandia corymbosa var. corymbosa TaxID=529605 RepID=A0AAV1D9A2_OLDCO|nr:OLC1v1002080C1 [Oldenlandia corymbosa var. corymbosa]